MNRTLFLALARGESFRKLFMACPGTKKVVRRFVPGDSWEEARTVVAAALGKGLRATVGYLGEDARTEAQVAAGVARYCQIIERIAEAGWADRVDLGIDLAGVGLLARDGDHVVAGLRTIADQARSAGVSLTVGEGHPLLVSKTLRVVRELRQDHPEVGYTLQATLKRTETDCRPGDGARIRLVKGNRRAAPAQALYLDKHEVDLSYVRCLKTLMEGEGTPLVATHDPIMIEIAQELAAHSNRGLEDFEFQMLHGVRDVEQERLADLGHVVRVYVPFGRNCYDYVIRRIAETTLWSLLRSFFGLR